MPCERALAMCGSKTRYPGDPIVEKLEQEHDLNYLFLGWETITDLMSDFLMFNQSLVFLCYYKPPDL